MVVEMCALYLACSAVWKRLNVQMLFHKNIKI